MSMDLSHVEQLEQAWGDPQRASSPINFEQTLHDDSRQMFPQRAADVLREKQFSSYYVPTRLGGRFERVDELLFALRVLSRRDLTLAIGHAVTMLGAIPVWVGGSPTQQAQCADLVLADRPLAFALTEREHGSDLLASDTQLSTLTEPMTASGEKWLINNATRGAAICVYLQVQNRKGARGSAIVFLCKDKLPADSWQPTPKIATVGIRGADISGFRLTDVPICDGDIVGGVGQGLDLVWRGLQVTRTLCSGLSLGAADTGLRLVACELLQRRGAAPTPRERSGLAMMTEQVLLAEAVALCATRLAHVMPHELGLASSVTKYYAPTRVEAAFRKARQLMGLRAVHLEGRHRVFEKLARDQALVSLFEGSTVVSLQMVATQLRAIARRAHGERKAAEPFARALFDLEVPLPPLAVEGLTTQIRADESVCRFVLHELPTMLPDDSCRIAMIRVLAMGTERLEKLYRAVLAIEGDWAMQDPRWFALGREYCGLFAFSALAALWHFNRHRPHDVDHPLFAGPDGPASALERLLNADTEMPPADVNHYLGWIGERISKQQAMSMIPMASPWAPEWPGMDQV